MGIRAHKPGYRVVVVLVLVVLVVATAAPGRPGGSLQRSTSGGGDASLGYRSRVGEPPQIAIEPYVRPDFAERMQTLRPVILAAAARHNRPALSGMDDGQFAEVVALLLYNEHFGWLEDDVRPLRLLTPAYQQAQVVVNSSGVGTNFSVWPANVRPSVALEILMQQMPLPGATGAVTVPVVVVGSEVYGQTFASRRALFAAITREITNDELAVEYLAANLDRGLYRAWYEGVPVSWRTLAGWHNQGIVQPAQIRANGCAWDYVRRTSAYLPRARALVAGE